MENPDRSVTSDKVEPVIKNPPMKKSLGLDGFAGEVYKTFKELIPILLKLSQKTKCRERFLTH